MARDFLKRVWSLRRLFVVALVGVVLVFVSRLIVHWGAPNEDERHPIRLIMQQRPDIFLTRTQDSWMMWLQNIGYLIVVTTLITFAIQIWRGTSHEHP